MFWLICQSQKQYSHINSLIKVKICMSVQTMKWEKYLIRRKGMEKAKQINVILSKTCETENIQIFTFCIIYFLCV